MSDTDPLLDATDLFIAGIIITGGGLVALGAALGVRLGVVSMGAELCGPFQPATTAGCDTGRGTARTIMWVLTAGGTLGFGAGVLAVRQSGLLTVTAGEPAAEESDADTDPA